MPYTTPSFPDRIIVGSDSREALDTMRALYEPIVEQSFPTEMDPRAKVAVPFVTTDLASAEMIKYASNPFLATKISFINEIASLCELVGADISEVAYGIGLDGSIGSRFLTAGIGWGGSCFPKDVAALRSIAREYDYEPVILDAAVTVNKRQRKQVISKLQKELHTVKGKRVALLGLSFKPNTDDLREAPSLEIAYKLDALGARAVGAASWGAPLERGVVLISPTRAHTVPIGKPDIERIGGHQRQSELRFDERQIAAVAYHG